MHAKSTPGFIVNRIARPFYAETLALLQEQAATPAVLDACVRGAGFRMGPCELMDLIGHDTNFAVTQSVYEANFFDKRYSRRWCSARWSTAACSDASRAAASIAIPRAARKTSDGDVEATPLPAVPLVLHGSGAGRPTCWPRAWRVVRPGLHARGREARERARPACRSATAC